MSLGINRKFNSVFDDTAYMPGNFTLAAGSVSDSSLKQLL